MPLPTASTALKLGNKICQSVRFSLPVLPRAHSTMAGKHKFSQLPLHTSGPLECALKGTVLLQHPYFNKGSAFTAQEREDFELTGLLPPGIQTLEQQIHRAYQQYSTRPDDLAKNTFLTSMKEQNEVLYFKVRGLHLYPNSLQRTRHGMAASI